VFPPTLEYFTFPVPFTSSNLASLSVVLSPNLSKPLLGGVLISLTLNPVIFPLSAFPEKRLVTSLVL